MKEAITNISKDQTYQLQLLLSFYHLDANTASKAEKYYRELRKLNQSHPHHLSLEHLMKTSIIIAEQALQLSTLQGLKAQPLCLALNQMISEITSVKPLVQGINMYLIGSCKPNQHSLKEGLGDLVERISFGLSYINKFQKAIQYFDFVLVDEPSSMGTGPQYLQVFKSFAWLLFLLMLQRIPIRHNYEADYLLISVLYLMVRYVFEYLRPSSAQRVGTNKDIVSNILSQLFQIFEIDHPAVFKTITAQVDDIFEQLIQNQALRYHQAYDFLSPALIQLNYKRIDSLYNAKQDPHSINYKLLLTNRSSTLTPAKHRKQTHLVDNRNKLENKRKSFASHKILTFDCQEVEKPIQRCIQQGQIRLPKNVRVSPSYSHTPLICARQPAPNTSPIEAFIAKTFKYNVLEVQAPDNEEEVLAVITKVLTSKYSASNLKDKVLLAYRYYLVLSSQYFSTKQYDDIDYNGIHCGCLTLSLLFALSSQSQHSSLGESVREYLVIIREEVAVSAYQVWLACTHIKTDGEAQHPRIINRVVQCLEQLITNELAWQPDSCRQIVEHMRGQLQASSIRQANLTAFVQSILLKINALVEELQQSFNLGEDGVDITRNIVGLFRQLLKEDSQLFENKSIHQLVLVSFYLLCRQHHLDIKFNDIIQHYQTVHHLDTHTLKTIVTHVPARTAKNQAYLNIIDFYNLHFLPTVKLFRHQSNTPPNSLRRHQGLPNQLVQNTISIAQTSPTHHSRSPCSSVNYPKRLEPKETQLLEGEQGRDETRIRARPGYCFQEQLQTEKAKSPRMIE